MKDVRRILTRVAMLMMVLVLAVSMCACGGDDKNTTEEEQAEIEQEEENAPKVVKSIYGVDEDTEGALPLQIDSVTLFEDGSVVIIPTDDLKKNEIKEEGVEGIYPFADSGKVKDIYLVKFGNGGYRTIVCLMDDGSLSALSANSLLQDHIAVVMDNVTNRDDYKSIEQVKGEDAYLVVGHTTEGEDVELDNSLNF